MTPEALAALPERAFAPERGWSAREFETLCASPYVTLHAREGGFALVRTIGDETELLTLAVEPALRRRGIAERLIADWLTDSAATTAFLEVAADNLPAQALYRKHGFTVSGRRKAYYARPGGPAVDALLMRFALTMRHDGPSPVRGAKTG